MNLILKWIGDDRYGTKRLLFRNGKLSQDCCKWKVTGYTTEIICLQRPEDPFPLCPACTSTPNIEISPLYFNGSPQVVVFSAVTGFIDVACPDRDLGPCSSTTLALTSGFVSSVVCSGNVATVSVEYEDCPNAVTVGEPFPLLSKDLRVIYTLEAYT